MFHEDWFTQQDQDALAHAMSLATGKGDIIEVGCWEGRSTIQIARRFAPEAVHCVDHWKGDLTDPASPVTALAEARDVMADFLANMDEAGCHNFHVHQDDWRNRFPWGRPIRFLFIDAQHTYREVLDNIMLALPDMAPGGVIAGHDADTPAVARAVCEALGGKASVCEMESSARVWFWQAP